MKKTLQLLLAPISFLYGLGVSIYQGFYLSGFFKTLKFSIPIISVGNLTVGGTGKSPHIEYLIRLLKDYIPVAVLCRGYRRKTSGHILLTQLHTALDVGDEPVQIKNKFPDVPFAVNSNRSIGIPKLLSQHPEIKTILLDDAFQHSDWQRREYLVDEMVSLSNLGWQVVYFSMDDHIKGLFEKRVKPKLKDRFKLIEL